MKQFNGTDFDLSTLAIPTGNKSKVLDHYHSKYTNSGAHGLCSHITMVFPLFENMAHYKKNKATLEGYTKTLEAFNLSLTSINKFPENGVLFLQPDHEEELLKISNDLLDLFPFVKPYNGTVRREDIHHHNTVGVISDSESFKDVESIFSKEITPELPISFTFDKLWLLVRSEGHWYKLREYKISLSEGGNI